MIGPAIAIGPAITTDTPSLTSGTTCGRRAAAWSAAAWSAAAWSAAAWSAAAAAALILQGVTVRADVPPPSQPPEEAAGADDSKSSLKTITVEAQREREIAARQARTYISAISVSPYRESLARWNTPICPLVAGLPREHGEFILTRVSQIAAAAGAPLGGGDCRGNFYVVVTADPDALLKAWSKRDASMFGDAGGAKVRGFLNASSPVRVWYNAYL